MSTIINKIWKTVDFSDSAGLLFSPRELFDRSILTGGKCDQSSVCSKKHSFHMLENRKNSVARGCEREYDEDEINMYCKHAGIGA